MDKIKITVILLYILSSFSIFGQEQCNKNYLEINMDSTNTCEIVSMSPEYFSEFYHAKKRLEIIKDTLPSIYGILKLKENKLDILKKTYQAEIDTFQARHGIIVKSLEDCIKTGTAIELDNIKLQSENNTLNKKILKCFGFKIGTKGGIIIGSGLTYGLIQFFKN